MLRIILFAFIFFAAMLVLPVRAETIRDGDLIKTADSFDVYITKIKGSKKFKRLILNPAIFNSYGHLKWENVKTILPTALDEYKLSEFVIEINPDGSVADPKVYRVTSVSNSDIGERRWLNISAQEFAALGYDWDSIYFINNTEASQNFYPTNVPLTYEALLPKQTPIIAAPKVETPMADTSSPILSSIKASKILADTATISWNTNETTDSKVTYGITENSLNFSASTTALQTATDVFSYAVKLAGLQPNTKYYYQAISTDPSGNISQVTTNFFTTTDCYGDVPQVQGTIQEAIDTLRIAGGKICVAAGTFTENLLIHGKDVKIVGRGALSTIIKTATASEVISIKNAGASTVIEQLSIQGGNPYGIRVEDAAPIIKNNHLIHNSGGIRILGNSRPTIEYNVFADNASGVAVLHNGNLGDYTINHNTFANNGKSGGKATVLLEAGYPSSPIMITNNIFSGGYIGVYEATQSNFYLWNNVFYDNSGVHLRRENSFYFGEKGINDLGVATKNVVGDPLLDSAYKPKTNSSAISVATDSTNIGAY